MLEKIKQFFDSHMSVRYYLALFLLIWLIAWTLNAIKGMHFDLDKFTDLYKWLLGQFAIESGLNTNIPWVKGSNNNDR